MTEDEEINKCSCGCQQIIKINKNHKYYGTPRFIHGHNRKGTAMTQQHKEKISKANTGRKLNEDQLKKISLALKGREPHQNTIEATKKYHREHPELVKKLVKWNLENRKKTKEDSILCLCGCNQNTNPGKKYINGHNSRTRIHTTEERTIRSLRMKEDYLSGKRKPASLGKSHTEKHKEKIRESVMKNLPRTVFKKGQKSWNSGKVGIWTDEQILQNKMWHEGKVYGEETRKKLREKRSRQILPIQDTSIELRIQKFLDELKIHHIPHYRIEQANHRCDIFVPCLNLVIECDGIYWHKYPFGLKKDREETSIMKEAGFNVLRLWEHEIRRMNLKEFRYRMEGESS